MATTNITIVEDPNLILTQQQWVAEEQAKTAKLDAVLDSAITKLKAIGLTDAEIEAIRSL
jgi:hypothetical protein